MRSLKWNDIKQKQPPTPESRRILARERAHVAHAMALAESRREQSDDTFLTMFARYVEALGGKLEVRAVFDDAEVVLNSDLEPA